METAVMVFVPAAPRVPTKTMSEIDTIFCRNLLYSDFCFRKNNHKIYE